MQESTGKTALSRREGGALLEQILDTPRIAEIVPRLPPETLYRVIERFGLEDCGALVALATPAQVTQVLDLDLWRSPQAGLDQQFDAERFGVWLEVLVDHGIDVAARTVAGLDTDLVAAGLAQHARIFHIATLEAYETTDGTAIPAVIERDAGLACDIAGNRIIARRPDAWDAIVDVLVELDASHPASFGRIMRACRALSNSRSELDGLDALLSRADQAMFDLADEREQRRATRGFASAAEARGFLETARRLRPDGGGRPPTGAHARPRPAVGVDVDVAVAVAAVAHAPSPAIEPSDAESAGVAEREAAATAVFELLRDAGVIAPPPRALLGAAAEGSPVLRFHALMQEALARDASAAMARQEEAAWLANVLMAGATIDARPFTAEEASDAVVATCNLGLEGWPASWSGGAPVPDTFFVDHDLVTVFQVGWTLLHDEVCVATAACLLDVLAALPAHDPDTQAGVADLRATLRRYLRAGTPWQSRDALDVLATLDLPAWSTLLALIAECPVLPATIDPASPKGRRTVDPSAFRFIAERRHIAAVHAFLEALPEALRG